MQQHNNIYVTQPYLPPLEEFIPYLEKIWENKQLTNNGPFHQQLENDLRDYLKIEHISLFTNGTLALVAALQALRIAGEVITTPYSFVATAHSLLWNGIKPVFVDIDKDSFNIDSKKIESAITTKTTAILPVHCYGTPCDVKTIQEIADNYNLKVIYDAAHAFGVQDDGGTILRYGDLSVLSFHATKVFNTFEGGAIVCPDAKTKRHIDNLKNFGFVNETTVVASGINAKMSEVNSAFGLLQLKYVDAALERRLEIDRIYRKELSLVQGIEIPKIKDNVKRNASYFPVLIGKDYPMSRDELYEHMKRNGVYCRRYFYPLISQFSMYRGLVSSIPENLSVAEDIAERVLCLPIYPTLNEKEQYCIIELISGVL